MLLPCSQFHSDFVLGKHIFSHRANYRTAITSAIYSHDMHGPIQVHITDILTTEKQANHQTKQICIQDWYLML